MHKVCIPLGMAKSKKGKKSSSFLPGWLIALGIVAGSGWWYLRSQLRFITFGSSSIPFQQISGDRINLGITLPVINASSLAATITGFTGYITSPSGAPLATVFLVQPVRLERFQENILQFKASIRLIDLGLEAGGLVLGGNLPTTLPEILKYLKGYTIKGQLRVYGLPLPIETPLV